MKHVKQTLGIIGFGNFGRLAASVLKDKYIIKIFDINRSKENIQKADMIGAQMVDLPEASGCDIAILAAPISQTEDLIKNISKLVNPGAIIFDTCSVKILPCQWLKKYLPKSVQLVGTHPMFGPVTTKFDFQKQNWKLDGLQIVLCPLRVEEKTFKQIKEFLVALNLEIIETTPVEHDKQNATTLGLVHYLGRTLKHIGIKEQQIFTPGYADLLKIMPHTNSDDWQLFFDMHNYNPYAEIVRRKFNEAEAEIEEKIVRAKNQDTLTFSREMIDESDKKIMMAIERRFKAVKVIGKIKKAKGLKIIDRKREAEIIDSKIKRSRLDKNFVRKLYKLIFSESYKLQK